MAKTLYTAAVDLGATSGRVILGAWSKNRLTLTEAHRFPNAYRELGAHCYWELGTFWAEVQTGLRKAVALLPKGAKLASVGVDTWGCDHVLLNDAGRLVFLPHAYRDSRTKDTPAWSANASIAKPLELLRLLAACNPGR